MWGGPAAGIPTHPMFSVLILVLVEDVGGPTGEFWLLHDAKVLILVLVEDVGGRKDKFYDCGNECCGLNPCFGGRCGGTLCLPTF